MYFPENGRILILGVGQVLCGDDGVGPYIVEELKKKVILEKVFILNAEETPEIYTDKIISFLPDYILIIDAIDFKKNPGDFVVVSADVLKERMPSTHSPSLKMVIDYLKSRINTDISILGVQPQDAQFGKIGLTPLIEKTAMLIVEELTARLTNIKEG